MEEGAKEGSKRRGAEEEEEGRKRKSSSRRGRRHKDRAEQPLLWLARWLFFSARDFEQKLPSRTPQLRYNNLAHSREQRLANL